MFLSLSLGVVAGGASSKKEIYEAARVAQPVLFAVERLSG